MKIVYSENSDTRKVNQDEDVYAGPFTSQESKGSIGEGVYFVIRYLKGEYWLRPVKAGKTFGVSTRIEESDIKVVQNRHSWRASELWPNLYK